MKLKTDRFNSDNNVELNMAQVFQIFDTAWWKYVISKHNVLKNIDPVKIMNDVEIIFVRQTADHNYF